MTQGEISLLSKGLKFCPTPKELNRSAIKRDLKKFGRKTKCRYHFLSSPNEQERQSFEQFKEKSSCCRVIEDLSVNLYLKSLEEKVMAIKEKGKNYSNLSKEEQQALKTLKNSSDIIIKEANKVEPLLFGVGKIIVMRLIDNFMIERSMSLLKR